MKEKKELVCKTTFLSSPKSDHSEPVISLGVFHQNITKDIIFTAFMTKSV